jgi:hypothetical protein
MGSKYDQRTWRTPCLLCFSVLKYQSDRLIYLNILLSFNYLSNLSLDFDRSVSNLKLTDQTLSKF